MLNLEKVKPNDLWYIVGLITTDGNLSKDGRHISLTSKDRDLLVSVRKALLLKNKIGRKARAKGKEKKYSVLQIGDKKFYKFLLNIGLTQRKSLTLGKLSIPDFYFPDFLRGVIDGDGNIHTWIHNSNGNRQWALRIFSGSNKFTFWLKEMVESYFSTNGKIHISKRSNTKNPLYIIKFGKFAAKLILEKVYKDGVLALNRKAKRVKRCLQAEDGLRKYGTFKALNFIEPGWRNRKTRLT